jgi:hypothetical protein
LFKIPSKAENELKSFKPKNSLKPLSGNTFKELKKSTLGRQ